MCQGDDEEEEAEEVNGEVRRRKRQLGHGSSKVGLDVFCRAFWRR